MKRILFVGAFALALGGQALAADLPPPPGPAPKAPAIYLPPAPVFSWTGIYVGVNGGYSFGTVSPTGAGSFNTNGFLGGGTLGGNYQFSNFVIGLEGDFDYNSTKGTTALGSSFTSNWLSTVRGRAGLAWDRVLFYGTGGVAFAPANVSAVAGFPGGSTNMTGWTAGGGLEYAFLPNWTAKVEYLYVNFPSPSIAGGSFKDTENLIRAGVNYKFNFW
jgi:outer membrane immunogenic protein